MATPVQLEIVASRAAGTGGALALSSAALAGGGAGAALLLRAGAPTVISPAAEALADQQRRGKAPRLTRLADRAAAQGEAAREVVLLDDGEREQALDCAVLPLAGDQGVLVIAHDVSLTRNLHRALVESRQRYKDLVECSTDFAWETDAEGRFVFVTPRGTHGYRATDLVGQLATDFHADTGPDDPPFLPPVPVEDRLTRFRAADGSEAWLLVCSIPLYDDDGRLLGARGVCRDVTAERERALELDAARERERLLAEIVSALQGEIDADHILGRALVAVTTAMGAESGAILRSEEGHAARLGAAWPGEAAAPSMAEWEDLRAAANGVVIATEGHRALAATRYLGRTNGLLLLTRPTGVTVFSAEELSLIERVADHLGIALEQVARQEALERLSRTDELTGLLNRRAFTEEAGRRQHLARRNARPATLMFVDLNNFKHVNDVHGHQAGDSALVRVADMLKAEGRRSDLVARLGGDEFALWLDETDATGAAAKAGQLLVAALPLTVLSGSDAKPLGLSIGIAVHDPAHVETLDDMIARADHAMYLVKRRKQPGSAIADPGVTPPVALPGEGGTR